MNVRLSLTAALVMLFGAGVSHKAQTLADPPRRERSAELELLVMPSAQALSSAAMGQQRPLADLIWVRSVLEFGERFDKSPSEQWRVWFDRMLNAVAELDPGWRTVYFYGATMLRINGGDKQSTRLFMLGAERLPEDAYFPFSVGMTIYLAGGDRTVAAHWVQRAADAGGPDWYRDLAVTLRAEGEGRGAARRFLVEEAESTRDPDQRKVLEDQIARLDHEEFSARLTELLSGWSERGGPPLRSVQDMVGAGLLREVPPDPLGAGWVIDPEGPTVLSQAIYESRVDKAMRSGRAMLRWRRPPPP